MTLIRPLGPDDLDPVLALNAANETETSPLTRSELQRLVGIAIYARRVEGAPAFLLAFDQTAEYFSPNYIWFRERYPRFVYVDRIIVGAEARGRGLARTLYLDLIANARSAGHDLVCAEVNSDPPNPGSDAMHASLGFAEVGTAELPDRGKSVRYLALPLS
ncbi:MAG: GNAT family N-acetyltransferase [Geminicoccaceae bacterium]